MPLQAYSHPRRTTPRRSGQLRTHAAFPFPAPQGGINTALPLPGASPLTALRMENFIPRALGCQLRKGYVLWQSNLDGEVGSFMKYQPATGAAILLAATDTGSIYNVTANLPSTTVPTPVTTVAGGQPNGEWTSLNFVTGGGVHVLLMVNPGGGYWVFDGTTFTQITLGAGVNQITGVDPDLFVFVTVFRNRIWFIEGGTSRAWFLPVDVYYGTVEEVDFGPMLPNGGALAALVNWTYDGAGGAGGTAGATGSVNTQLVVIGEQGDVLVYAGDDEDDPSLFSQIKGRWYVGRVPVGRRFFSLYLSDVIILSEKGMNFMSELMRGQGFFDNAGRAQAINSELAPQINNTLSSRYWEVVFLPQQQMIVINRAEVTIEQLQWVYEVNNRAFATMRGIPMLTVAVFEGRTFSGDLEGNVWWCFEGNSDGAIDDEPGLDLQGIIVTSFQAMGDPVRLKRFLMVRPSFISVSPPGIQAVLNHEWDLAMSGATPAYAGAGDSFWDVGLWDVAVWSGAGQSYESWIGATGTGRYASLALRIRGAADTIFVAWQALVEQGGIL